MLYLWGYISKKGAWISVEEDFVELLKKEGYEFPAKLHGEPKLNDLLEANPDLIQFLIKHFSEIIYQS